MSLENMRERLENAGQSHLLSFWEELQDEEKDFFLAHLETINFDDMNEIFKRAVDAVSEDVQKIDDRMKPIPATQFESEERISVEKILRYRTIGLEEISKGHVGVLLMAGGQGTRLGVTYPKGMYSVGLPSGKTLFQIQAERIQRIQNVAELLTERAGKITWYIMTSGPTDEATQEFLETHDYFGLNPEDVVLFNQGLMPCFDLKGKILLDEKNVVSRAPDGNGGIYGALARNGILEDMKKRGVLYVHVHSVDNILVKVADPVFVGYCVNKAADCGAKVVRKNGPNEAVGVVCQVEGIFQVVEYSEISEKTANLKDEEGNLVFSAGNICNHFFTSDFLQDVAEKFEKKLKLHVAKKKIPYVDETGKRVIPTTPNGIKIEKFVFDVFQFSKRFVTWEVPRETEFSALKNSNEAGKDCPKTAKRDLLALHKKLIENNGGRVEGEEVEISPLLSYAGENLENVVKNKVFTSPMHLAAENESQVNGFR